MVLLSSISKDEFMSLVNGLPERIPSVTGKALYYNIKTDGELITMDCDTRSKLVIVKAAELYKAYRTMDVINTFELRSFLSSRVYSPGYALLIAMGLYTNTGRRILL